MSSPSTSPPGSDCGGTSAPTLTSSACEHEVDPLNENLFSPFLDLMGFLREFQDGVRGIDAIASYFPSVLTGQH